MQTLQPVPIYALVYPSKKQDWNATVCYKLRVQLGTASRFGNGDYVELGSTKVVVFPNPVNFNANLVFNATKNGIADITVTNQ